MLYFSDKFLALFTNNTITHFTHTQVFFSQPLKNLSFEVVSLQYYCVMNKQVLALLAKQMLYNYWYVKFIVSVQGSDKCKL